MQNNILVTGGTGFIGTSFIELILKKKNYKIYSLSQKKILKKFKKKKLIIFFANYKIKKNLKKYYQNIDLILLLILQVT